MSVWGWLRVGARRKIEQATRDALQHGYTMHQLVEWAYGEVYFLDFAPHERLKFETEKSYGEWRDREESQEDATNRVMDERYEHIRQILMGNKYHPVLCDRDFTEAMVRADYEPRQGHDCTRESLALMHEELTEKK